MFLSYIVGESIRFIFMIDSLILNSNPYVKADETEQECHLSKSGDRWMADCTELQLRGIPSNLDPKIQILDLSRNFALRLEDNSFSKYPQLTELIISDLVYNPGVTANPMAFVPLKKLEILTMDHVFYEGVKFTWPSTLKALSLNNNRLKELDVSTANALQNLSLKENELDDVPVVHESAPLKILFLTLNPLRKLNTENLAKLCSLEYVNLELSEESTLNEQGNYCQCLRVETWLKQHNITGTKSLGCVAPPKPDCNLNNFDDATANYNECLIKHGKLTSRGSLFKSLLIGFVMFAVLISILGFMIYKYYMKVKSQFMPESAPATSSDSSPVVSRPGAEADGESAHDEESHSETGEEQEESEG